jgi:hypothetical protein
MATHPTAARPDAAGIGVQPTVVVHLFGHLEGDVVLRVVFIDTGQTVEALANQLQAWGPELYPHSVPAATVRNEGGIVLELAATLTQAGLHAGDIFSVEGVVL